MKHVHIKFHILTSLPTHSNLQSKYREKGYFEQKYRDYIGHFLKDRDFIGNIGTLEDLHMIHVTLITQNNNTKIKKSTSFI